MKALLCCVLFFACGVGWLYASEQVSDLDRMQGVWQVVSLVEKGKAVPAKEVEVLEVVIAKDHFAVSEKGKTVVNYLIKLSPEKTPQAIDFTPTMVETKDKEKKDKLPTELGIYTFDKDQLTLAIDEEGKARPAGFDEKATAACSVMVLKRKLK